MSIYSQTSFIGGMNLLLDDTRLQPNQYRVGFNLRNRTDVLTSVLSSRKDIAIPEGVKQECVTFGNYIILFVGGAAYYRNYLATGWTPIDGFNMKSDAPRYWTCAVPVSLTNYVRVANVVTAFTGATANNGVDQNNVAGASNGNLPGLLVQDNVNQPQFIYLDTTLSPAIPICRVTQSFDQWSITFTDGTNTMVADNGDQREYVPIGSAMAWVDGVLYITSQDGNFIYRSVSGRPLDFMVNIPAGLVTDDPFKMVGGGDARTTSYSVGVGGISALRAMNNDSLFVAASNANFLVSKNLANNAPKIFGEFTFIRTFLFNATVLSDRCVIDSLGDTKCITLTGIRSFNAVEQTNNEGRNLPFSSTISSAFIRMSTGMPSSIVQDSATCASILFDDYEFYSVETIFGNAIAVYDTINGCWVGFDTTQAEGKKIKMFAKIELSVLKLYAIAEDDTFYELYAGPNFEVPTIRPPSICSGSLQAQVKPSLVRVGYNNVTANTTTVLTAFVNNRMVKRGAYKKDITYIPAPNPYSNPLELPDVNTQFENVAWSLPDCEQGYKAFFLLTWSGGMTLTQLEVEFTDMAQGANPITSQGNSK